MHVGVCMLLYALRTRNVEWLYLVAGTITVCMLLYAFLLERLNDCALLQLVLLHAQLSHEGLVVLWWFMLHCLLVPHAA